jgi:hypothetical protein
LEGSLRAPLRLKENIGRAENRDEALTSVRAEDPCATDFRRKYPRDAQPALEKNFSETLVELAKFVLFGMAWALAMRVLLWPVSLARIFPLLFLCGMPLGLFSLVVFNRWRSCRELRELAWQQWIDCISPIAREYGVQSPVIQLSDRWRNYFERGLSPECAVSQYKSDCMAEQIDDEASQTTKP